MNKKGLRLQEHGEATKTEPVTWQSGPSHDPWGLYATVEETVD